MFERPAERPSMAPIASRFALLDGIRGVAAILVLTRHTSTLWTHWFFRSYLAVDVFFVLSGFVIGHAYDRKLATGALSPLEFLRTRLIRLYPVYALSALLCGAIFVGKSFLHGASPRDEAVASIVVVVASLFFLPAPHPSTAALFPTNNPYWSLFFELVSNAVYGALRRAAGARALVATLVVSGTLVAISAARASGLNVGYDFGVESIVAGAARSVFGIGVVLALFHHRDALLAALPRFVVPWVAAAGIVLALVLPPLGGFDAAIDLAMVFVVFPLGVVAASRPVNARFAKVLGWLGSASYPVYVLHVPLYSLIAFVGKGREQAYAPAIGLVFVVALILGSVVLEERFDVPVRRWLTERAKVRPRAVPVPA